MWRCVLGQPVANVSIITVPPSSGSSSPLQPSWTNWPLKKKLLRYVETSVTTHIASQARSPNPQTQRHYNIKSRNVQFVLPPLNKFCRHTVTLPCHKCSVLQQYVFCVLRKHPCIRDRQWTCDLWQCVHYTNRLDPEVTPKPLDDALCILTIATLSGHWSSCCHT